MYSLYYSYINTTCFLKKLCSKLLPWENIHLQIIINCLINENSMYFNEFVFFCVCCQAKLIIC